MELVDNDMIKQTKMDIIAILPSYDMAISARSFSSSASSSSSSVCLALPLTLKKKWC